jgi:hypothetical protein
MISATADAGARWPDGILDRLQHAVLQHRLLAANFLQGQFAALVVKLLETA